MAEGVRDIFSLLHATIRKHGQQLQTVRLGNAWVNVDRRGWKTRGDIAINVALGSGGKAQQFAQTMAIADIQKQLVAAGKINMVPMTVTIHRDGTFTISGLMELCRISGTLECSGRSSHQAWTSMIRAPQIVAALTIMAPSLAR
jgi:hypothetical protein